MFSHVCHAETCFSGLGGFYVLYSSEIVCYSICFYGRQGLVPSVKYILKIKLF